jgi:hypothetical protein
LRDSFRGEEDVKCGLEETRYRADDGERKGSEGSPNLAASCGVPIRRGTCGETTN